MRRRYLLLLAASAVLTAGAQRRKEPREPAIEVIEVAGRRQAGRVEFDGRVRNNSERPIRKLAIIFRMKAPSGEVVTTQKGVVDISVLDPGEDIEFHWQMRDHARAVSFDLAAEDKDGNDYEMDKPGPYPIE